MLSLKNSRVCAAVWVWTLTMCWCVTSYTDMSNSECPCLIDTRDRRVDCVDLGLTSVPQCIPNNTLILNLSGNTITSINDGAFERFVELKELILDSNGIEYLYDDTFRGLHKLSFLSLYHNHLSHNTSFSENTFDPLTSLHTLYIHGNCEAAAGMVCSYPDEALSKLSTLNHLFIDGYPNISLGEGFRALISLQSLRMDSDVGFCNLYSVPIDMFTNLRQSNLSYLEINDCNIHSLLPGTFSELNNLETLTMNINRQMRNDALVNITSGLNSPRLNTLSLVYINHDFENTNIPAGMFKDMQNSSLETLRLESDQILYVDPDSILYLPKTLKYMSLRDNIIGDAHFLNNIYVFENLETFDMSFQNFYRHSQRKQGNLYEIQQNNASNNTDFHSLKHDILTTLNDDIIRLPPKIHTIIMNNIKLGYPVPSLKFGQNKLRFLNASTCLLSAFLGPWFGLDFLEILDLSFNGMSIVLPNSFTEFRNLTHLYLQGNKLGVNINHDTTCQTFSSQARLQVLDLSDNAIHTLPTCLFQALRNIQNLSLAKNALTTIEFQVDAMINIKYINLSDNLLMTIQQKTLNAFDRIVKSSQLSLLIQGNNFLCGCKDKYFIDWLLSTDVNVPNLGNISCLYENKTKVSLVKIQMVSDELRDECYSWIVITVCSITFVTLLLSLSFVAVICHKRGTYMYLFRTGRKTLNPYHKLKNENVTLSIDAYISYDQDFEVFDGVTLHQVIQSRIYPGLKNKGLRVKIREELSGNQILSTLISDQLRHCHKVVVFLTEEFCQDFANSHEFHVAATEGIYTNRKIIIPVLVGSEAWDKLLPEIRSYLDSEEIAHFPQSEEDIDTFINYLESRIARW